LLDPGPLVAADAIEVEVVRGASPALDEAASAAAPGQQFLRAAWFAAAADETSLRTLSARRSGSGATLAAIPLVSRRIGPVAVREVPGSYWPFRSFPVAADATMDELAAFLAAPAVRSALGRVWRVGPVPADDPAATLIGAAAQRSGWTMLSRKIATCFDLDVPRVVGSGNWPSSKRRQTLRARTRRLAARGEISYSTVTGAQWSSEALDLIAAAEAESWVVREGGDPKFLPGTDCRRIWEGVIADPAIGQNLMAWLLHVGGEPAAFVFCLDAGATRHVIANGYSERFAEGSPGLLLLCRAFHESAASGVEKIAWGAGDAGYKSEMGAEEGTDLVDLLFVRGPVLEAVARPLWARSG